MDITANSFCSRESVRTLIAQGVGLQNKGVLYAKLYHVANELKSLDVLMNSRLAFAVIIYKAVSDMR